jgi:hypothetical protein
VEAINTQKGRTQKTGSSAAKLPLHTLCIDSEITLFLLFKNNMTSSISVLRRTSKTTNIIMNADQSFTSPMATRSRSSSVDSFDEEYFSKTYVPLSSLPTPPPSSHSNASTRQTTPETLFSPTEYLDPRLLGKYRLDFCLSFINE